jgi:predicted molibdopterin-dependent oxidoreductase YjgC
MSPAEAAPPPDMDARTPGVRRGRAFRLTFDGVELTAHEGETVLAALWAAGIRALHVTARTRQPRGFFCGMGVCFDCLVSVDGRPGVRACMEPARPGMAIRRQQGAGTFPPLGEQPHA